MVTKGAIVEEAVILSADVCNISELVQPMIEEREPDRIDSLIISILDLIGPLISKGQGELIGYSGWGFLSLFNGAPHIKQDICNAIKTALEIMAALKNLAGKNSLALLRLSAGIDWGDLFVAREGIDNHRIIGEPITMAQLLQSLSRDDEIVITNLVEPEDREFIKGLISPFGFRMLSQRVSLRDKKGKIIRIMEESKEAPQEFSDFFKNFFKVDFS